MGMEHTVTFPAGSPPSWPAARDLLASHGFPVQVRMIDGELAFPRSRRKAGANCAWPRRRAWSLRSGASRTE